MFTINSKSTTPIFEQIIDQIGRFIAVGVLKPNDQLPAVRTLAKELGINPNTVVKAYHECEMSGLIYSIPGKGSFVSMEQESVNAIITQAYQEIDRAVRNLKELGEKNQDIIDYIVRNHL